MAADIKKELADIDLGDKRRDRRIMRLASRMAEVPSESLRAGSGGWSEAMAAFRLFQELDYTSHKALAEVGRLDHETRRGFYAHNHLLVDEDSGVALGLYGSKIWTRDARDEQRNPKEIPFEEKESIRWFEGYVQACSLVAAKPLRQVLYIGDRESDMYEILAEYA